MVIAADAPDVRIPLGMQGEHLAQPVAFDVSAWQQLYGQGEVQLLVQRSRDTAPYPAEIRAEGPLIHWDVTRVDTAQPGMGEVQLVYLVDGKVAKSRRISTYVTASLGDAGPTPGDTPTWADKVLQAGEDAKKAAELAEQAKDAAEAATVHGPQIQNGTWHVWDMSQGKYVNTGAAATERGTTFTPSISPDGVMSWTNNSDLPNPEPVDLVEKTVAALPKWDGTYVVIPKADEESVLQTRGKVMDGDVVVKKIPYYDTSNDFGNTIYIASEV